MTTRTIRSNYLADKVTYTSSTVPVGTIIPIFKVDDDKVIDDGVVTAVAAYSINSGSGYTTDIISPAGFETQAIEIAVNPASTFSVSNDTITYPAISSILSTGDKIVIKSSSQNPNRAALGGSIQSFTITNGGSGYVGTPTVTVTDNGSGPVSTGQFQVAVSAGVVTGINVLSGGTGYQFPIVSISGGGGSNATATATLATGGTGGVGINEGQEYVVDITGSNTFRLARSAGDIAGGKFFNITDLGTSGNVVMVTSEGFGLRVGVAAQNTGAINYLVIKQDGYGYKSGDTLKILQPGSNGDGKVTVTTVSSDSADNPEDQYPGFLYCDGSIYGAADFPLLYEVIKDNYGGTGGSYNRDDFGTSSTVTFAVPDYKTKKLVGAGGGVSGGGSPVSGEVISAVGATGGKWYFSKSQQEQLMDIGNVTISGYTNVQEFVGASLTGEVTMTVGPLQEKLIAAVPEHSHEIMTSTAPQAGAFDGSGYVVDDHCVSYKDGTGQVLFFQPNGGVPLFHTHGIVDYIVTDPLASTYGNVAGIGTKITKSFTETAFNTGNDTITITGHGMSTGHKLRVQSNPASNVAQFQYQNGNPPTGATVTGGFTVNSVWYVVKVDDNTVKIATSKYNAIRSNTVDIVTNGDAATIVVEVAYNAAGNFPSEPTTTITTPNPTVWDIDNNYVVGGKTITTPGIDYGSVVYVFEANGQAGSFTVPASTTQQEPVTAIIGNLTGAGGTGANSTTQGAAGLDTYWQGTLGGYDYKIIAGGGGGGQPWTQLLQTRNWVAVGSGQISGGAAAVWSTFLLNNGIYPVAVTPFTNSDPYVGNWMTCGVGINVDASLAAAGFNVEFHCDGLSEMDIWGPGGPTDYIKGNATPPNNPSGTPQTSSATLVVNASDLYTTGWYQLKVKIKNTAATNGDNSWNNNPGAVGFVATRNDTGATMFTSRNECTGGTTTQWLAGGGAGGAGGTGRAEVYQGGGLVQTVQFAGQEGNTLNLTGGVDVVVNSMITGLQGGQGTTSNTGGSGANSVYAVGAGGPGSRSLLTGTQTQNAEWTVNTGGSSITYNVPIDYPVSSVTAELKGGGGGSGGTGDGGTGWYAGDGGHGKHVIADINATGGTSLLIWVGQRGTAGSGRNPGTGGSGFSSGGNGGSGTGGGGGGGGGGSTAVGIGSGPLIGAGGGGGGGAAGDGTQLSSMNGQPNPNNDSFQLVNGCFAGSGGQGNNSVCTGGGGGGGGGGVGSGVGIGGGGGAGNGSNAVKPGFGASRGQSSLISGQSIIAEGDATNGGDVNIGEQIDGNDGYVKISTEQNTTEYGPGGGGGGSGSFVGFTINTGVPTSMNATTAYVGNGHEAGNAQIGYGVTESTDPSTGISTTVGIIDASSDGCDYSNSGTGSGSTGGFISPDAQKYLRFKGDPQIRWARSILINASAGNSAGTATEAMDFEVIRGNGSNGGETPTAPLELYGSNDGGGSYTQLGTISTSGGATTWETVRITLPTLYRVSNLLIEIRQSRSASGNGDNDNYGVAKISQIHEEGEVTTYTTQSGRLDIGIESIQEVIAPQGDPINSAGITVNDGKFTLSSAVKLDVTPSLQPEVDIPLVTRYHLVKYLIRAY